MSESKTKNKRRLNSCHCLLLSMISFILAPSLMAANFNLAITVGGSTINLGFAKVEDVFEAVKTNKLTTYFPSYSETQAVSAALDFRGLPLTLGYAASSNNLILSIPSLGITETFSGTTRDNSKDLFEQWIKKNGKATLNSIIKRLALVSSSDSLAGNPNSLMSQMVGNDYNNASMKNYGNSSETSSSENFFGVGARYQRYSDSGENSKSLSLPLSYIVRFDFDPRHQLSFYLPLTLIEIEDAKAYNVSLGIAYRFPIFNHWSLNPTLGTGIAGSVDLGSGGRINSTSLTSVYDFELPKEMILSVSNMIGHYRTTRLKISDYESDPGIQNTVFRNGVLWSFPHMVMNWKTSSEVSLIDTRFTGTKLYMNSYQELGYSIGSDKSDKELGSYKRFGISYLYSDKSKGLNFNFGLHF